MKKSVLLVPVGIIGLLIAIFCGGAGSNKEKEEKIETGNNIVQGTTPAVKESDPVPSPVPHADIDTKPVEDPLRALVQKNPDILTSSTSITADQKVYVLVLHPENNRFIRCEKDVPLGEIKDLGNGRWSFPNGHGDAVTTDWLIMSQPYNEGDEETYVEVWKTTAEGDFVTDAVISERQIFLDPRDSKSIFVCWNGSYLDGRGVDKNELLDHIEEYYINPVPVKTETQVVRVTPLN